MDDMLSKPFRRQALQSLLDRWRSKGGAAELLDAQPQPASPASVLDQGVLQSLRELDPDGSKGLLQRTIVKFARYGDDLIADMTTSAIDRDMPELSRLAHSLKSSSANLGAVDLASQCQKIETLTRDITAPIDLSQHLEGLTTSYQTAKQALLSLAKA